jgi:uroporphyrin-3 C-methyltransferase/uroporphyrinogen III methyltransferase/synthase
MVLAIVSLVGLVWLAISVRNWMGQTREELGIRIVAVESRLKGETEQFSAAVNRLEDANARLTLLEQKLKESAAQQESLEQLYKSLLRSRDETTIVEVEQLLNLASQQLRLLGNVEAAILALQQAESRLGTQDRPSFVAVRKAIGRDLERLRALPKLDLVNLAQQLDDVLRNLDRLQLLSDVNTDTSGTLMPGADMPVAEIPAQDKPQKDKPAAAAPTFLTWSWWADAFTTVVRGAWSDVTQLVRVRSVDYPDAMMMAPSQAYFVRENLRLRLLNARLALLSRQQRLLRDDLLASDQWLQRYFDGRDPRVAQAQRVLNDIRKVQLAFELPSLQDSLGALRLNRVATER